MTMFTCPYCVMSSDGQHAADCPNNPDYAAGEWPQKTFAPLPPALSPPLLPSDVPPPSLPQTVINNTNTYQHQRPVVRWATGQGEVLGFVRWETGCTYAIVNSDGHLLEVAVSELTVVEE